MPERSQKLLGFDGKYNMFNFVQSFRDPIKKYIDFITILSRVFQISKKSQVLKLFCLPGATLGVQKGVLTPKSYQSGENYKFDQTISCVRIQRPPTASVEISARYNTFWISQNTRLRPKNINNVKYCQVWSTISQSMMVVSKNCSVRTWINIKCLLCHTRNSPSTRTNRDERGQPTQATGHIRFQHNHTTKGNHLASMKLPSIRLSTFISSPGGLGWFLLRGIKGPFTQYCSKTPWVSLPNEFAMEHKYESGSIELRFGVFGDISNLTFRMQQLSTKNIENFFREVENKIPIYFLKIILVRVWSIPYQTILVRDWSNPYQNQHIFTFFK